MEHTHPHTHPHTHDGEHTHTHPHTHDGEHVHSHDSVHAAEETRALLNYMIHHNEHHNEELADLLDSLPVKARKQMQTAIGAFEAANAYLKGVLECLDEWEGDA